MLDVAVIGKVLVEGDTEQHAALQECFRRNRAANPTRNSSRRTDLRRNSLATATIISPCHSLVEDKCDDDEWFSSVVHAVKYF